MRNLIFILLFVSVQADAQKISFVDTTNEWYALNTFWATSSGVSISMFTSHHYFYSGRKKINSK